MRIVSALLMLFVAGSGTAFAQRPEAGRGYPLQAGYPPYGFRVFTDWQPSNVRIDVSPDDARVFVDKLYAGTASDFGGMFRHLALHAGPHLIEIRQEGFRSMAIELNLYPGQSVRLSRAMRRLQADEQADSAPDAVAPSFEEGAFLPSTDGPSGELRFEVRPKDADIYADGFYVGTVDDFNGSQHMMLTQGQHHLVLKREGYDTVDTNLSIDSERTLTYRAAMNKLAAH